MGFVAKVPLPLADAEIAALKQLADRKGVREEDVIVEAVQDYLADLAGAEVAMQRLNDPLPGQRLEDILTERGLRG